MKLYRHILLLTLLPLLLIGCKEHKQIDGLQPATVELSIPVSTQRGGFLLVEDVPVQTLRILVFNKKGGVLDAQKRFEQPTSDLSDWLRVEAHEGEKIVYVIANEASGMTAQLDGILFESDLKGLPITDVDPVSDRKLLMVGSGAATLSKSSTTQIIVRLVPAKAKITLDLQQNTPGNDRITIRKVSINRLPKKSMLFTPTSYTLGETWIAEKSETKDLTNHATDPLTYIPNTSEGAFYVYENLGSVADTTGRAPILTVYALYNGIPTTYTAYVNDESTTADHHYSLHRNHHYKLSGTITKIGPHSALQLTTQVLPWDVEEIEKTLEPPRLVSINPMPQDVNYVTITQPITFRIKIKSGDGQNVAWHATLTNALDFRFDTTGGAVQEGLADGTTEYTVTVLPTKPAGAITRTTRLIFTTDLVEIEGAGVTEGIRIDQRQSY